MANINRVVLVGNLTRDPELRHTPSGTAVCSLRLAVNTRRKDGATGEWTEKPNYFDITVWGNQGENCAQYLAQGPAGRRSTAGSSGASGRPRTGRSARRSRSIADTVQFLGGRDGGGERGEPVRARQAPPRRPTPTSAPPPTTTFRSRGGTRGRKGKRGPEPQAAAAADRRAGASRASSASRRSTRSTTRTSASSAATSPRRARSARAGSAAPAAATSARSRSRSSAPARWRCCRTSPRAATTARAAAAAIAATAATGASASRAGRPASGRRQPRPARRGRERRARLRAQLPAAARAGRARDARASSPSSRGARRSAPATRRADVDEAQAIVARLEAAELRFDVKAGPTGSLFGSVTATSVADRLWETQKIRIDRRKLELGTIKRIGRYTAPVEVFARRHRPSCGCSSCPRAASCRPRRHSKRRQRPRPRRPKRRTRQRRRPWSRKSRATAEPAVEETAADEAAASEPADEADSARRVDPARCSPTARSPRESRRDAGLRDLIHTAVDRASAAVLHTSSTGCGLRRELLAQSEVFLGDRPLRRLIDVRTYVLLCLHIPPVLPTHTRVSTALRTRPLTV